MRKSIINSFRKNSDGSCTSTEAVSILDEEGTEVKVSEGITFLVTSDVNSGHQTFHAASNPA